MSDKRNVGTFALTLTLIASLLGSVGCGVGVTAAGGPLGQGPLIPASPTTSGNTSNQGSTTALTNPSLAPADQVSARIAPTNGPQDAAPLTGDVNSDLAPASSGEGDLSFGDLDVGPGGDFTMRLMFRGRIPLSLLEFEFSFEADTATLNKGGTLFGSNASSRPDFSQPGRGVVRIDAATPLTDKGPGFSGTEIYRITGVGGRVAGLETTVRITKASGKDANGNPVPLAPGSSTLRVVDARTVLTISDREAGPGSTVTVPVELDTSDPLVTMEFGVSFDPKVLEFVSSDTMNSVWRGINSEGVNEPGHYRFVGIAGASDQVTGLGTIVTLIFRATGNVGTSSPLDLAYLEVNMAGEKPTDTSLQAPAQGRGGTLRVR